MASLCSFDSHCLSFRGVCHTTASDLFPFYSELTWDKIWSNGQIMTEAFKNRWHFWIYVCDRKLKIHCIKVSKLKIHQGKKKSMTKQNRKPRIFEIQSLEQNKFRRVFFTPLEQIQVPNGTGPGVRRSKRPLLPSRIRLKCMQTLNLAIRSKSVIRSSLVTRSRFVYGHVPECRVHLGDPDAIMFDEIPTSTIQLPSRRFQTFPDISLLEKLINMKFAPSSELNIHKRSKPWHTV